MEFCTRSCLLPHVMAGSERSRSPALQRHLQGLPGFPTCCSQNLHPSVQTSDDPTMAYTSLQGFIPPICQFHLPVGCHPFPFAPPILPPSAFTASTFFSINLHLLLSNMPCSNTTRPAARPHHPPSTSPGSIHGSPPPAPTSDLRTYGFDLKSSGKGTVLIATTRRSMDSHFSG